MILSCAMPTRVLQAITLVTLSSLMQAQVAAEKRISLLRPVALRVQPGVPMQEPNIDIGLHIVVLQGQGGVNIIKKKAAVRPVIEVRDRTNMPVAGASVTFTAPNDGASAVFLDNSRSETVVTDLTGQATVSSMKPVSTGTLKLAVSASFQGQIAAATITQTNVLTSAEAANARGAGTPATSNGLSTRAVVGIVAGVAAAAAVGIGVGLASGKNSSSAGSISGPGTPTVGAPH